MNEEAPQPAPQIVIAIDSACPRPEALEEAAALAAQIGAELTGVFIENTRLMQLASMPFAAEIGSASARTRDLTPADLSRSFRSQAKSAERALRMSAERFQVPWQFTVENGPFVARIVGIAFERKSRRRPRERARNDSSNVLFLQRASCERRKGPGTIILDPSLRSAQRLNRAIDVAAELNAKELDILIVAGQLEEAHRQRQRVMATLARERFHGTITLIPPESLQELAQHLDQGQSATLILANARRLFEAEHLRQIADSLPVPIFLIR